ncbi:MAG TPA: hypothetical protein VIR00_11295, partial [Micromonosporaceae bacterium]
MASADTDHSRDHDSAHGGRPDHDHEHGPDHERGPNHEHGHEHDHRHEHGAGQSIWHRLTHVVRPHSHDAADKVDSAMEA